jgi:2-polyprenyl-3-methyl-5-hydroxy-6-metoxy-1,4-benzoquinol methylase
MNESVEKLYDLHQCAEEAEASGHYLPSVVTAPHSIDNLRHVRLLRMVAGRLAAAYPESSWLSVGDGHYGADAIRMAAQGVRVHASSLTDATLRISHQNGWIVEYSAQNAERMDLPDSSYDFVLCKEAYHHLPRPPIAFYEMLRVAKTAVVLIEPNRRSPTLLGFVRTAFKLATGRSIMAEYEPSGNYIFRLSVPELIEMARALDLPAVAWTHYNDFYHPRWFNEPRASMFERYLFRVGLVVQDTLCGLRLMSPGGVACAVFKTPPSSDLIRRLRSQNIRVRLLRRNPYLTAKE